MVRILRPLGLVKSQILYRVLHVLADFDKGNFIDLVWDPVSLSVSLILLGLLPLGRIREFRNYVDLIVDF